MNFKKCSNKAWPGTGLLVTCILLGAGLARLSAAQDDPRQDSQKDELQRTYQIHQYTEVAQSGPTRGENIYFYACFLCHNQYAKGGPPLEDLFKHPELYSGNPVNDETVAAQIKDGSARMPGFGHNLTSEDIKDVISYLKSGTCCYEADEPPANPQYRAATQKWPVQSGLRGGVHGLVRDNSGKGLEGIKVQLIAPNGARTTVFTNEDGKYEFPVMQTGAYTLRIATPAPYQPYRRDAVQVNGSGALDDIVLAHLPEAGGPGALTGALPVTPEVEAQLSGAELLWNLPGTVQEKTAFAKSCGIGCHSYQQVFRNRFTENDWRKLARRMLNYHGNDLVVSRKDDATESPETDMVIKWLAKVRGPESQDLPYRMFPRPSGASTRVVITEYEMPRRLLTIHDVSEDSKGNIWYTSHRSPNIGILDPRTGIVKEYKVPFLPGAMPGTHHVAVDKNDIGWYSEDWGRALVRLDPTTGEFKRMLIESTDPMNYPGFSNFALAPDGYIWHGHLHKDISKFDPETGKVVQSYPLSKTPTPYDNIVSADGRFYAAGSPPGNGYSNALFMDIRTGKMMELNSGEMVHSAARGGFDPSDNAWFGGRDGPLVEIVNEMDKGKGVHIRNYWPPTPYFPYTEFYSVAPDKNGEIWAPQLQGRGVLRFNPKTGAWRVYDNAEPSAFARNTWIDNKTDPVTIWYPDYDTGMIVRIQPLD